jgi:hypothetical protein
VPANVSLRKSRQSLHIYGCPWGKIDEGSVIQNLSFVSWTFWFKRKGEISGALDDANAKQN